MAIVKTAQTSFVSGELDPKMLGRIGKDFFSNSADKLRNVYVTSQGLASGREGLRFIAQVNNNDESRLATFQFDTLENYLFVFTPARLDIFKDDVLHQTITTAPIDTITAAMLPELNWSQSADTFVLVHRDLEPIIVTRDAFDVFSASLAPLANIPDADFGSGPEPIMSVTRGWAQSVAFFRQRLWFGGFKSLPQSLVGTKIDPSTFFDLNTGTGADDDAIFTTITDDRVNAIRNIFPGRGLQIFTTGGEFVIKTLLGDAITPDSINSQLEKQTLHGSNISRPVSVDGSTIFVENGGHIIRQFVFNDFEQSFNAFNVSRLSSHLIRNPQKMDVRQATGEFPNDYAYLVNEDGTMAVLNSQRDEELLAWTLFETEGLFKDIAVFQEEGYTVVERTVSGAPVRYIEKFVPETFTDAHIVDSIQVFTNSTFDNDISGFTDISSGTGSIAHDAVNGRLDLLGGAAGIGSAEESLTLRAVEYTITVDVFGGDIDVFVGTVSGASDIASGTIINGLSSEFKFTPGAGVAFISFRNTNNDTRQIDNIRLTIKDWTGLSHLEGRTVKVRGDNFILDDEVVTAGAIETSEGVSSVEVGLFGISASLVRTLPVDVVIQGEPTIGDWKRLVFVLVRLIDSRNIVARVRDDDPFVKPPFREFGPAVLDNPVPLFTGWKKIYLGNHDRDSQVTITQEEPLEFKILSLKIGVSV